MQAASKIQSNEYEKENAKRATTLQQQRALQLVQARKQNPQSSSSEEKSSPSAKPTAQVINMEDYRNRNAQKLAEARQSNMSKPMAPEKKQDQEQNQNSVPSTYQNKNRKKPQQQAPKPKKKKSSMNLNDYLFWSTAFVAALGCDAADVIPVAGWAITIFLRPYVIIFLFFQGSWTERLSTGAISMAGYIPIIGMLPETTGCVAYAFYRKREKLKKEKEKENKEEAAEN